jgi:hypothetical protein
MSLPIVHVVFIALSTVALVWLGWWGLHGYEMGRGFGNLLLGGGALLVSGALGWYGWYFVTRMRRQPR